ncbi:DNA-directed RNA polymerase, mitochondrial [Galendromus occidentalis]|uniref:DNA-directed RNA polymerase n=1 Tax=Galendromus occidentalis TaxID=34638 RepID=A0AAJ7L5R3_9ACAR|nr:DNA-directed RNA polymerase, mitochondrial [Galendromus occidentalis]
MMIKDNVEPDASTYAYLLAAAQHRDHYVGLIKEMSEAGITTEDLFRETSLTSVQLASLVQNIRCWSDQYAFDVPAARFPTNESSVTAHLKSIRQPSSEERFFDPKLLRAKSMAQRKRELAGMVTVKSIAAPDKPSQRVVFLRKQITKCENEWRRELNELYGRCIEKLSREALHTNVMCVHPYVLALDKSRLVNLLLQEMRAFALAPGSSSVSFTTVAARLGQKVELLYNIRSKVNGGVSDAITRLYGDYLERSGSQTTTPGREIWQSLIAKNPQLAPCIGNLQENPWTRSTQVSVGRFLYSMLRQLKVDVNIMKPNCDKRKLIHALYSVYRTNSARKHEELKAHEVLNTLYSKAEIENLHFDATSLPMLCPPKPWTRPEDTPYMISGVPLIRIPSEFSNKQMSAIRESPPENIYPALDALNALGRTPWKVNNPILDVLTTVFLGEGDMELSVPKKPSNMTKPEPSAHKARVQATLSERKKAEKYALWCDTLHKLSIAHHFKNDVFFFPHNMDFCGRAHPCPAQFHHLGDDLIRGLLLFAEGKPLGERGLWWLKLHLMKLTGFSNERSAEERVAYADGIMDDILDSARNPLNGRKWWQTSEDPWQTLAACKEIANALASPKPEEYICHLPIHHDGHYGGPQHYAAFGNDSEGALPADTIPMETPRDVYSKVADAVESLREAESAAGSDIASVLKGFIKGKTVKESVKTAVYGENRFGAYIQILRKLQVEGFPSSRANSAAHYLAIKTFESVEKTLTKTKGIQSWFTQCAKAILAATEKPVQWTTPLGLPVVQPYFRTSMHKCLVESDNSAHSILIPTSEPQATRQKNGFPPNFLHSLDSTHMMLTALYCEAAGIRFVPVHDCFWTHVSSVEELSKICQQQFVALHSEPLLEKIAAEFGRRYISKEAKQSADPVKLAAVKELQGLLDKIPTRSWAVQ